MQKSKNESWRITRKKRLVIYKEAEGTSRARKPKEQELRLLKRKKELNRMIRKKRLVVFL